MLKGKKYLFLAVLAGFALVFGLSIYTTNSEFSVKPVGVLRHIPRKIKKIVKQMEISKTGNPDEMTTEMNLSPTPNLEKLNNTLVEINVGKEIHPISGERNNLVEKRFSDRLSRVQQLCMQESYTNIKKRAKRVHNVITKFAQARLDWCHIPKIATTFLKRVNKVHQPIVASQGIKRTSREERKRFFLVREPYSRLVSGYICKIVTTPEFWKFYGKFIISKYRLNPSEVSLNCGHDVTFPEFVKYFITSQQTGVKKNRHFMPIHEQCNICRDHYDYIIHLETLKEDMPFVFQSVNVSIDIDMRDTEQEIRNKIRALMTTSSKHTNCYFPCPTLHTLWWSFQARGFISADMKFPLEKDQCDISVENFEELAVSAYKQFTDKVKRSKQKRDFMLDLYLQVPLADRVKIKSLLYEDFELFEYDSHPTDVFPELNS